MRTNLKQQFINRINSTKEPFRATFINANNWSLKETMLFEKFDVGWSADVDYKRLRFNVGKVTTTSVHLYSYVAGCKVTLVIPFYLLLHIQPVQP